MVLAVVGGVGLHHLTSPQSHIYTIPTAQPATDLTQDGTTPATPTLDTPVTQDAGSVPPPSTSTPADTTPNNTVNNVQVVGPDPTPTTAVTLPVQTDGN